LNQKNLNPITSLFLDRRLEEPDFKLIKSSTVQVYKLSAKKHLTGDAYNKHSKKTMKCNLSIKALVPLCDLTEEEAKSVKETHH
jgi:hypothetical protein